MTNQEKLVNYEAALKKHKAASPVDPWSPHYKEPTAADYGINDPAAQFMADRIRERVLGKKVTK